MTNSLQQMAQRREQWLNEKPGFSGGNELRLRSGDDMYGHFIATGEDGDQFIKVYRAHSFDVTNAQGKRLNPIRYCLLQNGDAPECPYCQMGHDNIKERMSMWFYVYYIAHRTMPANTTPDKMLPQFQDIDGQIKYKEEINDYRVWHTSAWKESPWMDILKLSEFYKGPNKFVLQMSAVGEQLQRRFKIYALPNSIPCPAEIYTAAQEKCTPIPQLLKEALATAVQWSPAPAQQPMQAQAQGPGIIAFNPVAAFAAPLPTPAAAPAAPSFFTNAAPAAAPTQVAPTPFAAPAAEPVQQEAPTPPWQAAEPEPEAAEEPEPEAEAPAPPPPAPAQQPQAAAAPVTPPNGAPLRKLF